jgi:radical SAM superfamily enzyme YgiQ (UPF0313 family)
LFQHALCVYPYRRELNHSGFYPPLGLEFIAAVVQPHAKALDLVDLRHEADRTKDFLRPETDLVCFSVNWDRDGDFVREEIRSAPAGVFTLVGGRHATEDPERWLRECPNVTALVRGDGEEATEEICRGVPLEQVAGVSFRRDGRIVHNPVRILGPVRDDLYPDRRLRRHAYSLSVTDISLGLKIDTVASSRGCPFNCKFCSFSRNPWGTKRAWTARSPESVVKELGEIEAPIVGFTDDLFTFDMDRVERICDLILAQGIRKKYIINARLEIARRPDILRKMEQAGFTALLLGIESTQDKTLRSMRKGFDVSKIREYFQVLRESSMFLHGYFIIGNIGETAGEMLQVAPFARELGLDSLGLSALRMSPYSGLDELVAGCPEYHISRSGRIYSDQLSTKDLHRLRDRILRDFFTARQVLRLLHKGTRNGLLRFLPALLPRLPGFAWRLATRSRQRARRRKERRAERATRAKAPTLAAKKRNAGGRAVSAED